jgi:bacteriocin-like protein
MNTNTNDSQMSEVSDNELDAIQGGAYFIGSKERNVLPIVLSFPAGA